MTVYVNGIINYYYPLVLTTMPYPSSDDEGISSTFDSFTGGIVPTYRTGVESFQGNNISNVTGTLNYPLKTYTIPTESFQGNNISNVTGTLKYTLVNYTVTPITEELLDVSAAQIVNITLREALIEYQDYPAEAIDIGGYQITGGSLT